MFSLLYKIFVTYISYMKVSHHRPQTWLYFDHVDLYSFSFIEACYLYTSCEILWKQLTWLVAVYFMNYCVIVSGLISHPASSASTRRFLKYSKLFWEKLKTLKTNCYIMGSLFQRMFSFITECRKRELKHTKENAIITILL